MSISDLAFSTQVHNRSKDMTDHPDQHRQIESVPDYIVLMEGQLRRLKTDFEFVQMASIEIPRDAMINMAALTLIAAEKLLGEKAED